MKFFPTAVICALCIAAFCTPVFAQSGQAPVCASLTAANLTYNQNFDTLASSGGGNTAVPTGFGFSETGVNANNFYTAAPGSSTADTYSFGNSPTTDRAFGSLRSSGTIPTIGACFVNNTGNSITAFTVKYDGELWYLATTGRTDRLDFQYSTDATTLTSGTWINVDALDLVTPAPGNSPGQQNGNDSFNRTAAITSTISSLTIANGAKFYIRFQDFDVAGSDDGLGIDNFSLTATPPPSSGTFAFDSATYNVNENAGTADLTVDRTGGTTGAATINYSFTSGTAVGGAGCTVGIDFDTSTSSVTFADGEASKTISVPICDETIFEANESFSVTLTSATGGGSVGSQASTLVTIQNDDSPATVQFSSTSFKQTEGSSAVITVERTGDVSGTASANYATIDGTATGGLCAGGNADFDPITGTVTFLPGETAKDLTFPICGDLFLENPAESFSVALSNPAGGVLGTTPTSTVLILDAATQFSSLNPMSVSAGSLASVYPSTISVSGFGTPIGGLRLTLFGVTAPQPENLEFLLVSPTGQNYMIMAGAGGSNALQNATLTFEDEALIPLPDEGPISEGQNYKPTNCAPSISDFSSPAPVGPYSDPGCATTNMAFASTFGGIIPDGNWTLYVRDAGSSVSSTISGWGLQLYAVTAARTRLEGRVMTSKGRGIKNATITVSGIDLARSKSVTTNGSGRYQLDGLTVNSIYVVTIEAKGYRFSSSGMLIKLQNTTELNFIAEP